MSEIIIEVSLYITFAISFLFLGGVLTGKIDLKGVDKLKEAVLGFLDYLPSPIFSTTLENELEKVKRPFRNPGYMWAAFPIQTNIGQIMVPFPVLRWWVLFEPRNIALLQAVREDFLDHFSNELINAHVYTCSQFASSFLYKIRPKLGEFNTKVFLYDELHPPDHPTINEKVIVFDLSLNTGKTVNNVLNSLEQARIVPDHIIFIILNDFVPTPVHGDPIDAYRYKVKYLYTASDLARYWEWRDETTASLLIVKEVLNNRMSWDDKRVNYALESLSKIC